MFDGRPEPADTAISLFARSLRDTTAENLESEYYDAGLLKALLQFRHFFHKSAKSIELRSPSRPAEDLTFGAPELEKVERLRQRIPEPRAFVISAKLDSNHHTDRRFWLELPDGQRIPGRVDEEFLSAENLAKLQRSKGRRSATPQKSKTGDPLIAATGSQPTRALCDEGQNESASIGGNLRIISASGS